MNLRPITKHLSNLPANITNATTNNTDNHITILILTSSITNTPAGSTELGQITGKLNHIGIGDNLTTNLQTTHVLGTHSHKSQHSRSCSGGYTTTLRNSLEQLESALLADILGGFATGIRNSLLPIVAAKGLNDAYLQGVGVLKLVDHQQPRSLRQPLANRSLGRVGQQTMRPGQQVVTEGVVKLSDGMAVRLAGAHNAGEVSQRPKGKGEGR